MLKNNLPTNVKVFINILTTLSDRDRIILIERFYVGKTLKQMARKFNTSDVNIKLWEDKVIDRIEESFKFINT